MRVQRKNPRSMVQRVEMGNLFFFFLPEPSFLASSSEQARVEDASISNQVFQLHSVSTFKSAVLDGILRCVHLPGFL